MGKKNRYIKKAHQKEILSGVTSEQAKGDVKKTAIDTGRDVLLGAIGGGLAGAVIGRSSFLVGIAVTGVGHYMGSDGAASFGIGMMASGGYQAVAGAMNGPEKEGFEGVKERLMAFKDEFKKKLFLDKIIKPKPTTEEKEETTNGMGEVQYFTYPNGKELEGPIEDLNRIEQQIINSSKAFEKKQSGEMNGEFEMGTTDSEMNF
jgi:hypothetical protein